MKDHSLIFLEALETDHLGNHWRWLETMGLGHSQGAIFFCGWGIAGFGERCKRLDPKTNGSLRLRTCARWRDSIPKKNPRVESLFQLSKNRPMDFRCFYLLLVCLGGFLEKVSGFVFFEKTYWRCHTLQGTVKGPISHQRWVHRSFSSTQMCDRW